MTDLTWGSVYNANAAPWEVPGVLSQKLVGTTGKPAGGWDEPGLEKIMTKTRIWSAAPVSSTSQSHASRSRPTGVIIGATIGSVAFVVLAGFVLLLCRSLYIRNNPDTERFEVHGEHKHEMSPDSEKKHYELKGSEMCAEMDDACSPAEAPRDTVTYAVELPGTNVQKGGLWGVPMVRTPSQEEMPALPEVSMPQVWEQRK
jgi:hypothetical protein